MCNDASQKITNCAELNEGLLDDRNEVKYESSARCDSINKGIRVTRMFVQMP